MRSAPTRNYVSEEASKSQQLLQGLRRQVQTAACRTPTLEDLGKVNSTWQITDLEQAKVKLNACKNRMDSMDAGSLRRHINLMNRAGDVVRHLRKVYQPEMCTVAWAKMYETIVAYDLFDVAKLQASTRPIATAHLCEAPGAFICATNQYLKTQLPHIQWDWRALTLNPYHEGNDYKDMISDDALIAATTPHWCFGADNSGDIRRPANIQALWQEAARMCQQQQSGQPARIMLVTADGAIDSSANPNEQEEATAALHMCEMLAAVGLLSVGGAFVIKIFTMFEHSTLCIMYFLGAFFQEVHAFKPATSKPANSEVYLVAKGFKGIDHAILDKLLSMISPEFGAAVPLFPLERLQESEFLQSAVDIAKLFADQQFDILEEMLATEQFMPPPQRNAIRDAKGYFAKEWAAKHSVRLLNRNQYLASSRVLKGDINSTNIERARQFEQGSLADRQADFKRRRVAFGAAVAEPARAERDEPQERRPVFSGISAKLMSSMGYKEGQGLGASGQGMASALEASGQKHRAGLGFASQGSQPTAPPESYAPAPDAQVYIDNAQPVSSSEAGAWDVVLQEIPQQMRQSKLLPAETLFADLCLARQSVDPSAASSSASSSQTHVSCLHSSPCLAPHGGHSPAFWILAAIDNACNIFPSRKPNLRLLDLARTDAGALEYAMTKSLKPEQLIALDSTPARQLKAQGKPVLLWNAWKSAQAVAFSTGKSTWQLQMPEQPLVDLVVGVVSHTEANAVTGLPAPNEHSTAYRNELLWRCLAALTSLANGGSLVLQLSDCMTMFTADVVYLMARCFKSTTILKPFASCVCSPERFLVCCGMTGSSISTVAHLHKVLQSSESLASNQCVASFVPPALLVNSNIYKYMSERNAALAVREVKARRYLGANPGQAEGGSRNAAIAEEKLCGQPQGAGFSQWAGRLSVKSHKGIERVGSFVCAEWPDHVAKPGDFGLVVVEYVPKQALQATVTFESAIELDASSSNTMSTFLGYLEGFRGVGLPLSAEKTAVVVLQKHGVVILSALSADTDKLRCQFAPSYK